VHFFIAEVHDSGYFLLSQFFITATQLKVLFVSLNRLIGAFKYGQKQ